MVVTLAGPPLARAPLGWDASRGGRGNRLALESPASRRYIGQLAAAQESLARRIETTLPGAEVRWRYRIVANGLAVSLPSAEVGRLGRIPGVERVYPSYRYRPLDDKSDQLIGAPELWGPDLETAGEGIKIGVIDDGIDQTHPFFDPTEYTLPDGFPKGDAAYTTAKVIVARAFPPPGLAYANAALPFDPKLSEHGTHVAGIAAGNPDTPAELEGEALTVSGVAPRAFLGNYKALTIPTENFGLNGNSPELVAAIEAAVADGMDVLNLSLGEPEIDPRRDIVVQALNAASDAGVVVAVAAGNEFESFGAGSIDSPGSAAKAITTAASTTGRGAPADRLGDFSSAGPAPLAMLAKPDVTAPGVDIVSSVPASEGLWESFSGTSMATPHAAGAAALLRQRHPDWTVAEIKSALVATGAPVRDQAGREVSPLREGGGRIALEAADRPLVFASPATVSFGYLLRGRRLRRSISLDDAGDGGGAWRASLALFATTRGVSLSAPTRVEVPGSLTLTARATRKARAGEVDGFVVLTRNGERRRVPFWLRLSIPRLGGHRVTQLSHAGLYRGNTTGQPSRVDRYLYPARAPEVAARLTGPEQVFRFRLSRPVANLGVVLLSQAAGADISPRIVLGSNQDRLAGQTALPINVNPYLTSFGRPEPVSAVLRPAPGSYEIVFDSLAPATAGAYRFRFWVDDRTPPRLRLLARSADSVRVRITDNGAGVDPGSIFASGDGRLLKVTFDPKTGRAVVDLKPVKGALKELVIRASDYQETKNDENSGALLPNTAELRISF